MDTRFSEPIDWIAITLCFAVWAAHFSVLWAASSVFPGAAAARWIALGATLAAVGALVLLRRARWRPGPQVMPLLASGLAAIAVLFGALPALVG